MWTFTSVWPLFSSFRNGWQFLLYLCFSFRSDDHSDSHK